MSFCPYQQIDNLKDCYNYQWKSFYTCHRIYIGFGQLLLKILLLMFLIQSLLITITLYFQWSRLTLVKGEDDSIMSYFPYITILLFHYWFLYNSLFQFTGYNSHVIQQRVVSHPSAFDSGVLSKSWFEQNLHTDIELLITQSIQRHVTKLESDEANQNQRGVLFYMVS